MAKERKLLTPIERAQLTDWGASEWMSSPRRMAARRRVLRTIGKLVEAQKTAKAPWPEDPRALADLLAVALRADDSIVQHFNSRGASDLKKKTEWDEFFRLFALVHLEQSAGVPRQPRPVTTTRCKPVAAVGARTRSPIRDLRRPTTRFLRPNTNRPHCAPSRAGRAVPRAGPPRPRRLPANRGDRRGCPGNAATGAGARSRRMNRMPAP